MRFQLCTLAWLFVSLTVCAQNSKQVLEWINKAHPDNKDFYFEIPFDYRNNQIVIQVTIGNQTYDYIFDTGGYNDITDGIQKKNNFPVLTTQTVGSSNGLKSKVNIVKVDSLKIGQLVFRDIAALQMNFDPSPTITCTVDGALIGASIIRNCIWQIDFSRRKILVTDRLSKIPHLDKALKVPVTFNNRLMPFIEAKIDGKKEQFMFDLGSSTRFSLTQKTALKYISAKQPIEVTGLRSEGGNGILVQTAAVFKADVFEIGSVKYKNKPVLYSKAGVENLIGNPIIKDFIVTMNFKDSELYLSPLPDTHLTEGWNSFGLQAAYKNDKVLVTSLFKGLPADKAGLKIDDEIVSANGKRVDCKNYCDCMVMLAHIFDGNTKLNLDIKSGPITREITMSKEQVY